MKLRMQKGRGGTCRPGRLLIIYTLIFLFPAVNRAQYLLQTGSPTFTTAEPVELGFVNVANGNLHIEIPLTSVPQRGSIPYVAKLVYDSRIWKTIYSGGNVWSPTNVANSQGGWRFVTTASNGSGSLSATDYYCNTPPPVAGYLVHEYFGYTWTAPYGTPRHFPIITDDYGSNCGTPDVPDGDAFADDSSGYHMYVTNYTHMKVVAKDGEIVYDSLPPSPVVSRKLWKREYRIFPEASHSRQLRPLFVRSS